MYLLLETITMKLETTKDLKGKQRKHWSLKEQKWDWRQTAGTTMEARRQENDTFGGLREHNLIAEPCAPQKYLSRIKIKHRYLGQRGKKEFLLMNSH